MTSHRYPWSRAIIVGASSGMGEAIARRLAGSGCAVALVARRGAELGRIADDLNAAAIPSNVERRTSNVEGPEDQKPSTEHRTPNTEQPNTRPLALVYPHDVTRYEAVPALFQRICRDLGGLDLIVYAAGVMASPAEDAYDFDVDRRTIEVNILGAVAWLNEAAQRFARAGEGTIVGISSAAGDRGRRGFPVYSASKAALNEYLEGLYNRVGRLGVKVVTVKPGPVDTPLTKGLDKLPMLISADDAARRILSAAEAGGRVAYVPGKWRPIMFVIRSIPSFVFKKLNI